MLCRGCAQAQRSHHSWNACHAPGAREGAHVLAHAHVAHAALSLQLSGGREGARAWVQLPRFPAASSAACQQRAGSESCSQAVTGGPACSSTAVVRRCGVQRGCVRRRGAGSSGDSIKMGHVAPGRRRAAWVTRGGRKRAADVWLGATKIAGTSRERTKPKPAPGSFLPPAPPPLKNTPLLPQPA
jgi:hypothetical protein